MGLDLGAALALVAEPERLPNLVGADDRRRGVAADSRGGHDPARCPCGVAGVATVPGDEGVHPRAEEDVTESQQGGSDPESVDGQDSHAEHGQDDQSVRNTFVGAVLEGDIRLNRSWLSVLATGAVGGIDLGIGVLAMLVVREATGSPLLGAVAFSIGFIALVLGKSELFTENFLIPVLAVIAGHGELRDVGRLWIGTLVANLAAGWLMMAIVVAGVPQLRTSETLVEVGRHFTEQGIGLGTFASAVLGGASITLLTWMERSTASVGGRVVAAVGIGFVLTATPLLHSIVSSLEMFGALWVSPGFGYADWLGMFAWAVLGNVVGGVGLVTVLRLAQATGAAQAGPRQS